MIYALTVGLVVVLWLSIVLLNEKINLLGCDRFPAPAARSFAYGWMLVFFVLLAVLVTGSALAPAQARDLRDAPFYSLFALHAILILFLAGWWLATSRPPLREFLSFQPGRTGEAVAIGVAVGVGGWVITIGSALLVATVLQALGLLPEDPQPSPAVGFMAGMVWWKKVIIVLSAMTVEEFFFRSWLQKRLGLIVSTALFVLAHFTLGQPLLLIGITVISLVIGYTFYRTKNVLPCIVAHGVFDAIQLFVIIPIAFKLTGM
ncbi:MAG TPA: type II CAAX endopeptidase family protein [Thermoanaerobaculia bacterium]|nr:type II CAAX endopeptidase family protein [Thermoanaerobaculia bacterium]